MCGRLHENRACGTEIVLARSTAGFLCHCLTNRGCICLKLTPVHRIGPSDAVWVYRLKHYPLADSPDVPHTLASMKCLRMAPICTQDCDWSLKSAGFHKVLPANFNLIPVAAASVAWDAGAAASPALLTQCGKNLVHVHRLTVRLSISQMEGCRRYCV